jgi:tRNA threonylcarbamoyladenosine biosynthesis protein TsaB
MRALAIETSGRSGALALIEDDRIVAEETFPQGLKHAAEMLPRLDAMLRGRAWLPRELGQLYVSVGPGSFTGLRIGITLAKTLAMVSGAKVAAVPSMRVLAENAPVDAIHLLVLLDARRGSVFAARYEKVAGGWAEREPAHLDQLSLALSRAPTPIYMLGEGLRIHQLPVDPTIIATAPQLWEPQVSHVARLGMAMARAGEFVGEDLLAPLYLRASEAEEKWAERKSGAGASPRPC